jgi:hypothetical protein
MKRATNLTQQRLAALGLLGIPLLTYPLVSLPDGDLTQMPMLSLYLFSVWSGLIALAMLIAEWQEEK